MQNKESVIHSSIRGAIFGLGALLITLVTLKSGFSSLYSLGDILLFIIASSMGGLASFIAVCVAEVPLLFSRSHDLFQVTQAILFFTAFGYTQKKFQSLQSILSMIPIWWLSTIPCLFFNSISFEHLAIIFCFHVFLLGLSRVLLLSGVTSEIMFGKQYRIPFSIFIPEILFLIVSIIFGITFFTQGIGLKFTSFLDNSNSWWFFIGASCLFVLPTLVGMMITRTLISEYGIDLKNIINSDFAKGSFVASSRSITGQRPDGDSNLFTDKPKNSIGFSSDESILFCTTGAEEILGVSSASLIGIRVQQTSMPAVLRDGFARLLVASRVRGNAQDEIRLTHDGGLHSQFIEIEMSYTKGSSDSSSGWLATITDITHKRTVETELLRAKKIEMLGVMSHGIAHSVADALTVIQSITGLTNDNKTAMEEIRTVAGNAGETIKQLLDYAGDHKTKLSAVDLVDLIKNRLEFFKQTVGDSCCIECTHNASSLPVTIDERTVLQAISHLLLNAKESYSNESDSQQIELDIDQEEISSELAFMQPGARAGHYARLRIKDHGEGISTEIFSKIFDPLYSSKSGHTGLGLSVVFAVMRAHDGFLTVESTPKKGTTVSLYFPLNRKDSKPLDTIPVATHQTDDTNFSKELRRALIIEDDDAVRRILELLLKQLGITYQSFISGEDVLSAENLSADFFITDLILPGMQGTVVAERIIERLGIPGLIATGTMLEKNTLPKRTELLAKPYGIEELSLAIQKLKSL